LENGISYWLKFPSAQSVTLTGAALTTVTIPVSPGWNMIGSIGVAVPVSLVTSNPPGLAVSPFFTYESGYTIVTSIDPHKGYWVRVTQNGELMLNASGGAGGTINIVETGELPPDPPFLMSVVEKEMPTTFALEQNYPNPFNPSTLIRYSIAGSSEPGAGSRETKLVVYDLLGREVAVLVNEKKSPGRYEVKFDARLPGGQATGLASGVYLYRLTAGDLVQTRKLAVVK
jgi:hypothetical protein